jgi:hypothetical protein
MSCGCTLQGACCAEGKELWDSIAGLYRWLIEEPSSMLLSMEVREPWWRMYEEARRAYFVHIELREVATESEVA